MWVYSPTFGLVFCGKCRQICQSHGSYGINREFVTLSLKKKSHPFRLAIFSLRPWLKRWHNVMVMSSHERTDVFQGGERKGSRQGKTYMNADMYIIYIYT